MGRRLAVSGMTVMVLVVLNGTTMIMLSGAAFSLPLFKCAS